MMTSNHRKNNVRTTATTTTVVAAVIATAAAVAVISRSDTTDTDSNISHGNDGFDIVRDIAYLTPTRRGQKGTTLHRRLAIPDENQAEKIRQWNQRLLQELLILDKPSSTTTTLTTTKQDGIKQTNRRRQRQWQERRLDSSIMTMDHHRSKTSDTDEDSFSTQPQPQMIQQMHDKGPPQSVTITMSSSSSSISSGSANMSGGGKQYQEHYYYPMYTSTLTIGTCTNNGNEPDRYHESNHPKNFLFDTLEECCQAWYVDVVGCTVGNAFPSSSGGGSQQLLLIRDTSTGELLASFDKGDNGEDMVANSALGDDGKNEDASDSIYPYYPSFDAILFPDGACLNDGHSPPDFAANPKFFFFDTDQECCQEWFLDVNACLNGGDGDSKPEDKEEGEGTYWPTWSDDEISSTTEGGSSSSSLWPTWADDDIKMEEDAMVQIANDAGSLWPTWSTVDLADDDDDDNNNIIDEEGDDKTSSVAAEIALSAPLVNDSVVSSDTTATLSSEENVFYDSFETGDFTKYDWGTPTLNPSTTDLTLGSYEDSRSIDAWEVDRTSMAYDGHYAARAGMLRSPGSHSNLTITFEGLDVSRGGMLVFAIRAMVEMPVDVLYLTVDNEVVRTYDEVTTGSDEDGNGWAEDSVMLTPGKHVVTWSYQYFGLPHKGDAEYETYTMDPRRVGNSWIDGIALVPLTGDMVWPDSGEGALMMLHDGHGGNDNIPMWSLVSDAHAFLGEHSFIAYTEDITSSSRNYAELSWTIVAGPAGGVLSFAAYGSIFAPLDILEFRIDGVPQVALTVPTSDWVEHYINIEPGKHALKWRLIRNAPGLSEDIIDHLDFPEGYQGYAKLDGVKYVENQVYVTSTTSTSMSTDTTARPVTTTEMTAEVSSTTTTEATLPTTSIAAATSTSSEPPMQEAKAEITTSTTSTAAATTTSSSTTTLFVQDLESTGCPAGLKPVDGLPNCCLEEPNYLGDGACDPLGPYNTEECAFDLGDCCYETCNKDSPYGCLTVEGNADEVGPFGFFCLDPRYSIIDVEKCNVENRGWIGDGGCDAEGGYNTEECGWDMGDCCKETCNEEFSFYPCGSHQPFACIDPMHSEDDVVVDAGVTSKATDLPDDAESTMTLEARSSTSTSTVAPETMSTATNPNTSSDASTTTSTSTPQS